MTRSATRLEVSTLPAATAAGARALSTQPSGATISTGRWAPGRRRRLGIGEHAHGEEAADLVTGERAVEVAVDLFVACP